MNLARSSHGHCYYNGNIYVCGGCIDIGKTNTF